MEGAVDTIAGGWNHLQIEDDDQDTAAEDKDPSR